MGYKIDIIWSKWVVKPWSIEKETKKTFSEQILYLAVRWVTQMSGITAR